MFFNKKSIGFDKLARQFCDFVFEFFVRFSVFSSSSTSDLSPAAFNYPAFELFYWFPYWLRKFRSLLFDCEKRLCKSVSFKLLREYVSRVSSFSVYWICVPAPAFGFDENQTNNRKHSGASEKSGENFPPVMTKKRGKFGNKELGKGRIKWRYRLLFWPESNGKETRKMT